MISSIVISVLMLIVFGLLFYIAHIDQKSRELRNDLSCAKQDLYALERSREDDIREARGSVGYYDLLDAQSNLIKANLGQKIPLEVVQDMKIVLREFKRQLFDPEVVQAIESLEILQNLFGELSCDIENFDDKDLEE